MLIQHIYNYPPYLGGRNRNRLLSNVTVYVFSCALWTQSTK